MYSKPKSILKSQSIDLYEEVETARLETRFATRSEQLFDEVIASTNNTKKVGTYANYNRRPLMAFNPCLSPNKTIDSNVSDNDSIKDTDFEPSAKTSRKRVNKVMKKRQNRVKFTENCDKKVSKKTQNKNSQAYPDCTKEALLEAFQMAGLPDYEEISKLPLHVTKVKDYVKPDPPTPPMHQILEPFTDLVDWDNVDKNSDEPNPMSGSAKHNTVSSDWETDSEDIYCDLPQNMTEKSESIVDQTVKSVSNSKSILKTRNKSNSKLDFRRESLKAAGVGANRIASTPVLRRHNVTLKNISPISSLDSPEVGNQSTKSMAESCDNTFVAPLPPPEKSVNSRKVPKISVPRADRHLELDVVEPSLSDLQKVTLGYNRSKQLTRSLIDSTKPSIMESEDSSDESQTIVGRTQLNIENSGNTLRSTKYQSLRNRSAQKTGANELSSIFAPIVKSTPLVSSLRQKHQKNSKYELVVDRSHFDSSMTKFCRSKSGSTLKDNTFKITTIIAIPMERSVSQTISKNRKQKNGSSNVYHMYRKSIASVHSIYNKSCQPFRTVVMTSEANKTLDDFNNVTISALKDQRDLKKVFNESLSTSMFLTSKVVSTDGLQSVLTSKQKVLLYCEPNKVIDFKNAFDKQVLNKCHKIGEGSYGEVFASKDSSGKELVIKIIPLIHNENQTEDDIFAQILPELVISLNFNRLKEGFDSNRASNFIDMKKATLTKGLFPSKLLEEWDLYDQRKRSENEDPRSYTSQQLYIVLHLANGGTDLESYQFTTAVESLSVFAQLSLALSAAEEAFQFEHRDLHWGNVLVSNTSERRVSYKIKGKEYSLSPNGVFASIIDFSLSRMTDNEFIIFDDLSKYSDLFEGCDDYQFDVYRLMRDANGNDWEAFVPKTNIFWLHYMLDKTIRAKKYTSTRTKVHRNAIELMKTIYDSILGFNSATELIESQSFVEYLSHLN